VFTKSRSKSLAVASFASRYLLSFIMLSKWNFILFRFFWNIWVSRTHDSLIKMH